MVLLIVVRSQQNHSAKLAGNVFNANGRDDKFQTIRKRQRGTKSCLRGFLLVSLLTCCNDCRHHSLTFLSLNKLEMQKISNYRRFIINKTIWSKVVRYLLLWQQQHINRYVSSIINIKTHSLRSHIWLLIPH